MSKIESLATYLNCNMDEIEEKNNNYFRYDECDYMVMTDDEAEEVAKNEINETLYSYYPSVLAEKTGLDEIIFETFNKTGLCESLNEPIRQLIDNTIGFNKFAEEMIEEEGMEHYIHRGDGIEFRQGEYLIYEMGC